VRGTILSILQSDCIVTRRKNESLFAAFLVYMDNRKRPFVFSRLQVHVVCLGFNEMCHLCNTNENEYANVMYCIYRLKDKHKVIKQ
jgi:hypothetical protein